MALLGRRLRDLESRFPPAPSEHEAAAQPVDPPPPLLDGAPDLPRQDQVALVRLALLEQTSARVLGEAELRRRLDELAGTYDGTVAARRARQWAERLNP